MWKKMSRKVLVCILYRIFAIYFKMAINKKNEFAKEDIQLAELLKALSHPARVAILRELAKRDTCICGEIVEVLPLAQSTVSQHLKELINVGLIKGTVDGLKSCYCLNPEKMELLGTVFQDFIIDLKKETNCC